MKFLINEPNKEILQTIINDKLFKRNENIIYEIKSNKTIHNKKSNFVKTFKILVEKQEISIEIGKLAKDRNKKEISVFMDHINKVVGFKMPTNTNMTKKEKPKGISSLLMRVPTRRKNIDFEFKFPEISMENVKKNNELKNKIPIPRDDKKNLEINKNRIGIGFYKKNK